MGLVSRGTGSTGGTSVVETTIGGPTMQQTNRLRLAPRRRSAEHSEAAIALTAQERTALIELGLRPTYSLVPCDAHAGDVELMLANAALWMQAAEITRAGAGRGAAGAPGAGRRAARRRRCPTRCGTWSGRRATATRGEPVTGRQGFPELGAEATEALYAEYIDRERRRCQALRSLAAKLHLIVEFTARDPGLRRQDSTRVASNRNWRRAGRSATRLQWRLLWLVTKTGSPVGGSSPAPCC